MYASHMKISDDELDLYTDEVEEIKKKQRIDEETPKNLHWFIDKNKEESISEENFSWFDDEKDKQTEWNFSFSFHFNPNKEETNVSFIPPTNTSFIPLTNTSFPPFIPPTNTSFISSFGEKKAIYPQIIKKVRFIEENSYDSDEETSSIQYETTKYDYDFKKMNYKPSFKVAQHIVVNGVYMFWKESFLREGNYVKGHYVRFSNQDR